MSLSLATEAEEERANRGMCWRRIIEERGERYALCQLREFELGTDEFREARKKACEAVKKFCEAMGSQPKGHQNLVFAGPSGSGKDHLMFYALRYAVMQCGVRASWIDGQRLFGELRDGITEERTERELLREYVRADVLAISDPVPPNGGLKEHQRNVLYRLIDERYSHYKPIWVTVNAASPRELDERMGIQLVDRLLHDAVAVNCYWPSYRRAKR